MAEPGKFDYALFRVVAIVLVILWWECSAKYGWSVRTNVAVAAIIVATGIAAIAIWRNRRRPS